MDRITDTLFIGDISDLSPLEDTLVEPEEFDSVITCGPKETPYTTEQYDIETENVDNRLFFDAVESVRRSYREGKITFVHCMSGISRNSMVTATALAAEEDITLDEAFDVIAEANSKAKGNRELGLLGEQYLANETANYTYADRYEETDDILVTQNENVFDNVELDI